MNRLSFVRHRRSPRDEKVNQIVPQGFLGDYVKRLAKDCQTFPVPKLNSPFVTAFDMPLDKYGCPAERPA